MVGEVPQLIVDNYWSAYNTTEQNLTARYPQIGEQSLSAGDYDCSDFWMFNGAYFRLKNITLEYNIPSRIVEKCKLKDVSVYSSISDLFSIDHYPEGWDPETSSYWITKSMTLGISVKF